MNKPLNHQTGIVCRELCQCGQCGCKGLVPTRRLWKRAGFGVLLASSPATPMGTRDKLIWMCFTLSDNQIPSEKKEIQDYCPDPCSPNKNDGGESTCRSWHTLGLWYLFLLPLSFSFLFPNPQKNKNLQAQKEPKSCAGCFWAQSLSFFPVSELPPLGNWSLGFFLLAARLGIGYMKWKPSHFKLHNKVPKRANNPVSLRKHLSKN